MSKQTELNTTTEMPRAPWRAIFGVFAALAAVFTIYRIYQHETAFTFGLDYFSEDFQTYWMSVLYAELLIVPAIGVAIGLYLLKTRDRNFSALKPVEELGRYMKLVALLLGFVAVFYVTGSIYAESDAAWHQVTVRDTDFTPTHIGLFYFSIPVLIVLGVTSFMYARTRLPQFAERVSLPFAIAISGPIMIMPNLGFNEWGHTFFYAEELFAAPVHWGFVLLGWAVFAAGGLLVQILGRVGELMKQVSPSALASAEREPQPVAKAA